MTRKAKSPPCRCLEPGFCLRYQREMPTRLFDLCRTRDEYRMLWAKTFGVHDEDLVRDGPRSDQLPCIHRGVDVATVMTPVGSLPVLACSIHAETTGPVCEVCQDRCETYPSGGASPRIEDHLPLISMGPKIKEWAVGVVTAPRKDPTLGRCLASMTAAGWDRIHLFAEPGTDLSVVGPVVGPVVTQRETKLGAWPNYYYGLIELLDLNPTADAFLIAQDDVIFWPGDDSRTLREYLEAALWPSDQPGFVSLYCSKAYHQEANGWHQLGIAWIWGACAILWPRESLVHFLATTGKRWTEEGRTHKVDVAIGRWQIEYGREAWYCSPSLTQHIGDTSTVWESPQRAVGKRAAKVFVGDVLEART